LIGYLEGKILKKEENRILLLVNRIGYEVLLPEIVMETLAAKAVGDEVALFIYYQQTERQPKPVLIGFNLEVEKEFFEHFISVEDIGPLKAVKALNMPIGEIASAIEEKDLQKLRRLKGIGNRTAQKIIATLEGKMDKYALIRYKAPKAIPLVVNVTEQVVEALVTQLGYRSNEARQMVSEALERNRNISSPEELFEEVYHGGKSS